MHSMYHLAKVIDVFARGEKTQAADTSVQAHLEMWDENLIIFGVHPELAAHIQKGNYVLVEYGFHAPNVPVNTVVKLLDTKQGEAAWKRQRSYLDTRRKARTDMDEDASEMIGERGMVR